MKDFIFHNPDRIYFGKDQLKNLPNEIKKYGKKALLVYGGGSIKRNGIYDEVTSLMSGNGIEYCELSGVEPNPRHSTVDRGGDICKKNGVEVIIAVGGGSVIDCAKVVAAAALTDKLSAWDIVETKFYEGDCLPVIAILTIAATGSEMDEWAVVSHKEKNQKISFSGKNFIPRAAFENPEYTYSLPAYQTACGSFDIFNHVLDGYYFPYDDAFEMILMFQEAVMKTVVKFAPVALKEPDNYEARANLMWASSLALNSLMDAGMGHGCACHAMQHELSAFYDMTHGHGLAILTPRWLEYVLNDKTAPQINRLGENVFDLGYSSDDKKGAIKTIDAMSKFCFETLGLKSTLTEIGIGDDHFAEMAEHACFKGPITSATTLYPEDIEKIYRMCL